MDRVYNIEHPNHNIIYNKHDKIVPTIFILNHTVQSFLIRYTTIGLSVNVLADQAYHQVIWFVGILFPH